jgi:hypothetical protein
VSQDHSHLTTEQLSAWLDQQLPTDEQERVATHVQQCAQCQARLSDLKQTVALLHALPTPQAPRSFTLSANAANGIVTPITSLPERIAATRARNNQRRNSGLRTTMRVMSTLAAVVGICFLLSSVIPGLGQHGTSTTGTSSSTTAPNIQHSDNPNTPLSQPNPSAEKTATAQARSGGATPGIAPAHNNRNNNPANIPTILDLGQPMGRALLGLVLVVLGILGFLLLSARQPRAP